jgi:hypothetical protein
MKEWKNAKIGRVEEDGICRKEECHKEQKV